MSRTTSRTLWTLPPRLSAAFRWAPVALSAFPALAMAAPTLAQEATPVAGQPCAAVIADDAAIRTQRLQADCVTDQPLFVTNGWAFDGGGHTIFAVDPPGGRLQYAVLAVIEGAGDVRDVTIDGSGLTELCQQERGQPALGGVVFFDSTGAAQWVTVRNMNRALPPGAAEVADGLSQRESCGDGIAVIGEAAQVAITGSMFANIGSSGVLVERGAATISHSAFTRVSDVGVLALAGAQVEVAAGNQFSASNIGVQFEGEGTAGSVTGSTFAQLDGIGVVALDGAQGSLSDNQMRDVTEMGVAVTTGGSLTSERDTVARTGNGFVALGGVLRVVDAEISACTAGVLSGKNAMVEVAGGAVRDCAVGMFVAGEGSRLTASRTHVTGSARVGVSAEVGGQVTLEDLWMTKLAVGIDIAGQSHATIRDLELEDATGAGLVVSGGSAVTLSGSSFAAPGRVGLIVTEPETRLTAEYTTIRGATGSGVEVQDGAGAEFRNLQVYGGEAGVAVSEIRTTTVVDDAYIAGSETSVLAADGGEVSLMRLFAVGSDTGVLARGEGARVTVRDSTINRPAQDGVRAETGGWVQVEETAIADAGAAGIVVRRGTTVPQRVELVMTDAGCTPRVLTFAAGVRTTVRVVNEGSAPGQLIGGVLGVPLNVSPGVRARVNVTADAGDSTVQCVLPGGGGAAQDVILRAVPADQFPASLLPTEAMILRGNTITGGVNGIVVEGAFPVTITGNTISGVSGEPLALSPGTTAELADNALGAATPAP